MGKTTRFVSKVLFYMMRFLAMGYLVVTVYAAYCLSSGYGLLVNEGSRKFTITYPFTDIAFLVGDYHLTYILFDFLLVLAFYAFFFYLAGNVFRLFHRPRLFTTNGVMQLRFFCLSNLLLPLLGWLLASFFASAEEGAVMLVAVHMILGVFAYFLAAIFTQGLKLQGEQDLII